MGAPPGAQSQLADVTAVDIEWKWEGEGVLVEVSALALANVDAVVGGVFVSRRYVCGRELSLRRRRLMSDDEEDDDDRGG